MRILDLAGMIEVTIIDLTPMQVALRIQSVDRVVNLYVYANLEDMVSDERSELRPVQAQLLEAITFYAATLGHPLSMGGEHDLFSLKSTLQERWRALALLGSQKEANEIVGDLITGRHITMDDQDRMFPAVQSTEPTAAEVIALVARRAATGNPIRYEANAMMDQLLHEGRVVMCMKPVLGSLDVPAGRYGSTAPISERMAVLAYVADGDEDFKDATWLT
jgi:hypothetical protein